MQVVQCNYRLHPQSGDQAAEGSLTAASWAKILSSRAFFCTGPLKTLSTEACSTCMDLVALASDQNPCCALLHTRVGKQAQESSETPGLPAPGLQEGLHLLDQRRAKGGPGEMCPGK